MSKKKKELAPSYNVKGIQHPLLLNQLEDFNSVPCLSPSEIPELKSPDKIINYDTIKKKKTGKKFQTSSASNFKIIPGFSQKGR